MSGGSNRLLETGDRLPKSQPRRRLASSLLKVAERRLPQLSGESMMGQAIDVLDETIRVQALDAGHRGGVQREPTPAQDARVGHVMGERVLEGEFHIREEL